MRHRMTVVGPATRTAASARSARQGCPGRLLSMRMGSARRMIDGVGLAQRMIRGGIRRQEKGGQRDHGQGSDGLCQALLYRRGRWRRRSRRRERKLMLRAARSVAGLSDGQRLLRGQGGLTEFGARLLLLCTDDHIMTATRLRERSIRKHDRCHAQRADKPKAARTSHEIIDRGRLGR